MLIAETVSHNKAYSRLWSYRLFPRRMLQVSDNPPYTERRLRRVYITPPGPPCLPQPDGIITQEPSAEPCINEWQVIISE